MNAGRIDQRVEIQTPTVSLNALGEPIETWGTLAIVWAEVRFLKGRELVEAHQKYAEVSVKFVIRYSPTIVVLNAQCRIIHKTVTYDIEEWLPIPGGRPDRLEALGTRRAD